MQSKILIKDIEMAIDTKSIQVCLWKVVRFSMNICFNFVKKYPAFSSVSFFFFLLYVFLPRVFTFLIYSLLIVISTVGVYRFFFRSDLRNTVNVKSYKKNDGDSSVDGEDPKMATNRSISANSQPARTRNLNEKAREGKTDTSNVEDKSAVCSVKCNDDVVDKGAVLVENPKDIKEVKADSVAVGVDRSPFGFKRETERSGDLQEDIDNDVEWTADDQKNHMDLGNSEVERYKRLESMIARRKVRKLLSLQDRNTLMSLANNDHVDHLASILVPRSNPYVFNNSNGVSSPGSAPCVLLPMHNPFDIPYETNEERPNLTGDGFDQEFLAENQKDLMLCRHESFRWGGFFPLDTMEDQSDIFSHDIPFKPKAPQKLKNPMLGSDLENKNVGEVISNGGSAEDHATQDGQASPKAPHSVDIHHEEDQNEIQKKEMLDENITEKSNSSSSSEENIPICRPNKDAILRSLTSLRRNIVLPKDDDYEVNGFTHNSDQSMQKDSKTEDQFFNAAGEIDLSRCNSLASDMQVQVSEISSPRSISSPREEYSTYDNDMKNEDNFGSSSRVDTRHESNSREVPEISYQQDIFEVGVSRMNQKADPITPDVLPENGLPSSSEDDNRGNETIYDLGYSETPTNNMENLNMPNNMDNGAHEGIMQPRDLSGSSGGSNSNHSDHQTLLESSPQNQQNERGESSNDYEEPKLQPKFSSDQVSSTNLSQGLSVEAQKSKNQIVEDDLVHEVPPVKSTHSAPQNAFPETDESTFQVPHDAETYQSPRFLDALSCVPFRPKMEEHQNHDPSTPTYSSRFQQEVQESYPHQNSSNHESNANNFVDKLVVNENESSSRPVETNEGENASSLKRQTASGFMEPSNTSGSKSTELEHAANQQKAADAEDNSLANKALETVFEPKQTKLNDGSSNLVRPVDTTRVK